MAVALDSLGLERLDSRLLSGGVLDSAQSSGIRGKTSPDIAGLHRRPLLDGEVRAAKGERLAESAGRGSDHTVAAELVGRGSDCLAAIVFTGFREQLAVGELDRRACLLGAQVKDMVDLLHAHLAARHLRSAGVPTIAWRQGIYGSALVAAGLDGYECGMGVGERGNVRSFVAARKPRKPNSEPQSGFAASGIYIPSLRRLVPPKVARLLFDDARLRGRIICDSITCCPRGADSMLQSKGRAHSVRSRARELAELAEMPSQKWRLNHIAKQAASAYVTATKANEVLARASLPERVKTEGYATLEQTAELLRTQQPDNMRDTARQAGRHRRRPRRWPTEGQRPHGLSR